MGCGNKGGNKVCCNNECGVNNAFFIIVLFILLAIILSGIIFY